MAVNQVEVVRLAKYPLQHQDVSRDRINAVRIKPQCFLAAWNETSVGEGVTTREQSDIVAESDQLFRQPGNDSLRAAIKPGRNALIEWCDLGDSHSSCS